MKPIFFSKGRHFKLAGTILICVSFAVAGTHIAYAGTPEAEESPAAEEVEPAANWATFTIGGFAVDDNDAAFQRRYGNNGDFYGGLDSFHLEQEVGSGSFTADGHALFGLEDYEVALEWEKEDLGFIRGGYREFRTWYDGSGGFLPGASAPAGWIDPITFSDDELELDRGELWFEAGLRMEEIPSITFGYSHRWRDGRKDTSIWAIEDTSLWGLPAGPERGVVPGYYDIDETSDTFWLDVEHTIHNTDLALSLRYQMDENDNTRRAVTQSTAESRDVWDTDLFSSSLSSQTRINDQMMVSLGYLFTTLDTDVDGSLHDEDVFIYGGSQFSQHVANASFWWNPIPDLVVVPSMRVEWENINAGTIETLGSATDPTTGNGRQNSGIDVFEAIEELEFRYSGIRNVLLYATAEWNQADKDLVISELSRNTRWLDVDSSSGKYVLGANYYPLSNLSLSSQYYYKSLDQDFSNAYSVTSPTVDGQLLGHAVDTHDLNLRATWRALPCLVLVTRYDYQRVNIENQAFRDSAAVSPTSAIDSAEIKRHILSESATWNVTDQLYVQGSIHWISSETDTPANERDKTTNTNGVSVDPSFIPDWDNDYITASLSAGYALTKNTDIILNYSYYSADNYLDNSADAVPYGTDAEEHAFTLTMVQRINANMIWNLRYGYFHGEDDAAGGFNDYEAHLVSTGLQIRF